MASRVILVTGANRGIGYSIVQALGTTATSDTLLLASRERSSAEKAISQLKDEAGIKSSMHAIELDVTDETTINESRTWIEQRFGRLDVLINNAGIALAPDPASYSSYIDAYQRTFETNITAVGWLSLVFDSLLRKSAAPRVINVSSGRASMSRSSNKQLPPTAIVPYSISKVGLNALTLEQIKGEQTKGKDDVAIEFYVATPGHCKTAFNGYKGKKDPLDGAKVVVELTLAAKGAFEPGFWEFEGEGMAQVPW